MAPGDINMCTRVVLTHRERNHATESLSSVIVPFLVVALVTGSAGVLPLNNLVFTLMTGSSKLAVLCVSATALLLPQSAATNHLAALSAHTTTPFTTLLAAKSEVASPSSTLLFARRSPKS